MTRTARKRFLAGATAALLAACADAGSDGPDGNGPPPATGAKLELIAADFDFPTHLTAPPGDSRLFVVEKTGRIRIVADGRVLPEPFLDLSALVSGDSEQGLLSMAFHPRYAENGRFFVDYTDLDDDTRVVEYHASPDSNRAEPAPVATVLAVAQPYSNHNGGLVLFGPDGMLYVGLGDGGAGGDPQGNGQNLGVLLGKILRLDVDSGSPYAIPPDNPFAGRQGARGEIWAYGLRNPWRFSFDRGTGELYIADVGQNLWEEIHVAPAGRGGQNYGWARMEGAHCFEPPSGCDERGLTQPVLEYDHDAGCSITGGCAYRGAALPGLAGTYFYADYCSGFVRSFKLAGGQVTGERSWPALERPERLVTSFGEDAGGEIYILLQGGAVYRVVPEG